MRLLLTCEHGGNDIPGDYREIFADAKKDLNSHRGFDPGALDLFHKLSGLAVFSEFNTVSRLLIELNRSLHHPKLFSEYSSTLNKLQKRKIIESFYLPYREKVTSAISGLIEEGGDVLHISVHSFTPILEGKVRNADIGLLYDPARQSEKDLSKKIKASLWKELSGKKIRLNYPYLGKADGFTTYLRKKFPENYAGIELEVNQKFCFENKMQPLITEAIFKSLFHLKKTT